MFRQKPKVETREKSAAFGRQQFKLRSMRARGPKRFFELGPPLEVRLGLDPAQLVQEGLNSLIFEYLLKMNLPRTLEAFLEEIDRLRRVDISDFPARLLSAFDRGDRIGFMETWVLYVPKFLRQHHKQTVVLEFKLVAFFVFSSCRPPAAGTAALEEFRHYLSLHGEELSRVDELLPYFALPFMRRPHDQPLLRMLLSDAWRRDLRVALEEFLATIYSFTEAPRLLEIYDQHRGLAPPAPKAACAPPAAAAPAAIPTPGPGPRVAELLLKARDAGDSPVGGLLTRLLPRCGEALEHDDEALKFISEALSPVPPPRLDLQSVKQRLFALLRSGDAESHSAAEGLLGQLAVYFQRMSACKEERPFLELISVDLLGPERMDKGLRLTELAEKTSEDLATAIHTLEAVLSTHPIAIPYLQACVGKQPRQIAALMRSLRRAFALDVPQPAVDLKEFTAPLELRTLAISDCMSSQVQAKSEVRPSITTAKVMITEMVVTSESAVLVNSSATAISLQSPGDEGQQFVEPPESHRGSPAAATPSANYSRAEGDIEVPVMEPQAVDLDAADASSLRSFT